MPKACSPTALAFPMGAANRLIPIVFAASWSIFSTPAPTRAINLSRLPCAKNAASMGKRLRTTIPSKLGSMRSTSSLGVV